MSWIECGSCEEMIDVCGGAVRLPYICGRCENAALAIEQDPTSDDYRAAYNSGVPCQSALDSVQTEQYIDPYAVGETDPRVHAMHTGDILNLFDADSELIADLRSQLDEAHADNASLTEEIDMCDRRVRAYQMLAAKVDKYAAGLEGTIEILKSELRDISIRANDAVFDTSF
jgi:chromosome condensin MukBEF ATPase and DNA-binding subunit MukB